MDTLNSLDLAGYGASILLTMICAELSYRRARVQQEESIFYYILTGFFSCICMSNVFYLLTWLVDDYPFVFSPGDISWVGGILFLMTAVQVLMERWSAKQRRAAKKYRLAALAAPAVCAVFNAIYISIYPEITLNYLLYGIPTAILAYLSLFLMLSAARGGLQLETRFFSRAVLLWIGIQLFFDLFYSLGWDSGYAIPALICGWIMVFLTAGVYIGARKGVAA